jgi:putative ABC transport system ATP-binding protein
VFIELRGIGKYYRTGGETTEVLQDINLRIDQSEFIAITGPSGSGKTTLAHTIAGLVRPDRGEVVIEGRTLNTRDDSKVSRYRNEFIGFVFQNYSLLPNYTVLENVQLPLMIARVKPKRRKAIAMNSLTSVGLGGYANRYANELSGGQRQRVAIARAITHKPELIVADEPTGNLDSAKGREIMTILQALSREKGITVVVVTHDLELAGLADRIIHLKDGAISGAGHAC